MHIFVTGGTGFIGSHFINAALNAGHQITALRRSQSSIPRIPLLNEPKWIEAELHNIDPIVWVGVDVLVHLAAGGVTPQPATWESCYQVNVTDTLTLVTGAVDAGVKRVIVTGTYAEYGLAGLRFDPIPPDAPLEPTDPYAASKASASIALTTLCRHQIFELVYYRLFSVYGEGQYEQNFWPQLKKAALAGEDFPMTSGEQVRDFISVEKTAEILLSACVRHDLVPGKAHIANLASGYPIKLRDFAATCWKQFKASGQIQFGEVQARSHEVMRYVPLID